MVLFTIGYNTYIIFSLDACKELVYFLIILLSFFKYYLIHLHSFISIYTATRTTATLNQCRTTIKPMMPETEFSLAQPGNKHDYQLI